MKDRTATLLDDGREHRGHLEAGFMIFGIGFVGQNDGIGHLRRQCFDHAKRSIEKLSDEIFELRCRQTHFFFHLIEKHRVHFRSLEEQFCFYFS